MPLGFHSTVFSYYRTVNYWIIPKLIGLVRFSYPSFSLSEIVNNGLDADRKLCRPLNHSHANFNMGPFLSDLRFLSSTLSIIKRGLTDLLSPSKYFKHSNQQRESTSKVRPDSVPKNSTSAWSSIGKVWIMKNKFSNHALNCVAIQI